MPGSSYSCTSILIPLCHNSGANTTHTKFQNFLTISPEFFYLTMDAADLFIFKNRCTLLDTDMIRTWTQARTWTCTWTRTRTRTWTWTQTRKQTNEHEHGHGQGQGHGHGH
jgi:hypothetical protein